MPTFSKSSFENHAVLNQVPRRENINEYLDNQVLVEAVREFDAEWSDTSLQEIGALVGSSAFQRDAVQANLRPPVLETHDRYGYRIDRVTYDESYHRIIRSSVQAGTHTSAWADPSPGANVQRAAAFMMFAQVEPGHACPMSMSHAAVPTLRFAPDLEKQWLPRLLSRHYSPELGDGDESVKSSALFGMAMTEKQGGSDVRANLTHASPIDSGEFWLLTGHKWFCSAPMSDAFMVLAKHSAEADSVTCFLVPRVLPDGSLNNFRIQRLKNKLGNHSNASAEIELNNTVGFLVGEPGQGVKAIIEMVSRTRLDCVLGSAAGMRQAVSEALWHADTRKTFGNKLIDQPAMAAVLADLALESEAATLVSMRLARAHDDDNDQVEEGFRRLATAITKYWVCKRGPGHAYEAMECLGGNGYIEDFPLAARYREQPVMAIWEGSGNVIALDVLRAIARQPYSLASFRQEIELARGNNHDFDRALQEFDRLTHQLVEADAHEQHMGARRFAELAAILLQASLMIRYSPPENADLFIDSRISGNRGAMYGAFQSRASMRDLRNILSRH